MNIFKHSTFICHNNHILVPTQAKILSNTKLLNMDYC